MNVYCVYWGDKYKKDYVPMLRDQVAQHLKIPHEFRCITDADFWDVDTVEPLCDYPGWWQKIGLFSPAMPLGDNLYIDLDVRIVRSLEPLVVFSRFEWVDDPDTLICAANWAKSGHLGCQSSVMLWKSTANHSTIWRDFDPEMATWPPVHNPPTQLWGDQEWITVCRDRGSIRVAHTPKAWIVSYKYHCGDGLPKDSRIVVFHGNPKPHQVSEPWML
jgi:hypothetical protein